MIEQALAQMLKPVLAHATSRGERGDAVAADAEWPDGRAPTEIPVDDRVVGVGSRTATRRDDERCAHIVPD